MPESDELRYRRPLRRQRGGRLKVKIGATFRGQNFGDGDDK